MADNLMRTFISIHVPNEVKSKKNMLYSTLENSPSNISWVKNEQLHLTLKFLGHTPEASFDNIKSEISKIASTVKPFKLVVDKTGCFPKKERPSLLQKMLMDEKDNLLGHVVVSHASSKRRAQQIEKSRLKQAPNGAQKV